LKSENEVVKTSYDADHVINECGPYINFLPSDMTAYRKAKFEAKFIICNNVLYYFGLC